MLTQLFKQEPTYEDRAMIRSLAACNDDSRDMTTLYFSEDLYDIARAKHICGGCPVREPCFDAAVDRGEPCGVWGGELFLNGRVLAQKRRRGRPPKVRPPEPEYDEWGQLVAEAQSA